jgi:hypothetical protein
MNRERTNWSVQLPLEMLDRWRYLACAMWFLEQTVGDEIRPFKIHVRKRILKI